MSQFPIVRYPQAIQNAFNAIPSEAPSHSKASLEQPPIHVEPDVWREVVFCFMFAFIPLINILAICYAFWRLYESFQTYPQRMKLYKERFRNKQKTNQRVTSSESVHEYRKMLMLRELQRTETYDSIGSDARVGSSEPIFQPHLEKYFGSSIRTQVSVKHPDFPHQPYTPDFVYVDLGLGLHIDIEIDEPYYFDAQKSSNSCEPNHYLGQKKEKTRDGLFNSKGWVVIRFSEEQIIRQPIECCKVIAHEIALLTGNSSILQKMHNIGSVIPTPVKVSICTTVGY